MTGIRRLWRPWIRAGLGVAISAGFAAVTLSRVELALVADAWQRLGVLMLGAALGLSVVEVAVRAVRWRILLRPLVPASFPTAVAYLSIGHLANAILPARLGDLARAVLAGPRLGASRASVLGTIAVERVADASLLGMAATLAVLIGYRQLAPALVALAIAGFAVLAVIAAVSFTLGRKEVAATRGGALLLRNGRRFVAGGSALQNPASAAGICLLTVASYALAITIMSTVAAAVGLSLPIWQAALIMAAVTLSTAIPAGPAAIGTYEFAGVTVMAAMGHPAASSLLVVGLVHVTVTLPPALMGLAAMWLLGIRQFSFGSRGLRAPATEHGA